MIQPQIAHVINLVSATEPSDLVVAQPITIETMRVAREFARETKTAKVGLFAVQLHDEQAVALPECFVRLPALARSVVDIRDFAFPRKLPLIRDILDALFSASDSDYFVYSNVDIALMPNFFTTVARIIEKGHDAFAINRRTISNRYREPAEIPLMYSELGEKHQGWDCFVFKRSVYPRFRLGNACIGAGWFGRVMLTNLACLAGNFKIFTDMHLTFHIGNELAWRAEHFSDYLAHNRSEWHRAFLEFEKEFGPFDRNEIPGRFLVPFERQSIQGAKT